MRGLSECQDYRETRQLTRTGCCLIRHSWRQGGWKLFFLSVSCQAFIYHPPFLDSLQYVHCNSVLPRQRSLRAISLLFLVFRAGSVGNFEYYDGVLSLGAWMGGGGWHNPEQALLKTVSYVILSLDPDGGSANFCLTLQNLNLNCLSILKLQNVGIVWPLRIKALRIISCMNSYTWIVYMPTNKRIIYILEPFQLVLTLHLWVLYLNESQKNPKNNVRVVKYIHYALLRIL